LGLLVFSEIVHLLCFGFLIFFFLFFFGPALRVFGCYGFFFLLSFHFSRCENLFITKGSSKVFMCSSFFSLFFVYLLGSVSQDDVQISRLSIFAPSFIAKGGPVRGIFMFLGVFFDIHSAGLSKISGWQRCCHLQVKILQKFDRFVLKKFSYHKCCDQSSINHMNSSNASGSSSSIFAIACAVESSSAGVLPTEIF
jgi:hypothetical protein